MFKKLNCDVFDLGIIKDNFIDTKKKILRNSKNFDLLITSGGISSSSIDKVSELLLSNGLINFWKLAIKPGRPIAFGKIPAVKQLRADDQARNMENYGKQKQWQRPGHQVL